KATGRRSKVLGYEQTAGSCTADRAVPSEAPHRLLRDMPYRAPSGCEPRGHEGRLGNRLLHGSCRHLRGLQAQEAAHQQPGGQAGSLNAASNALAIAGRLLPAAAASPITTTVCPLLASPLNSLPVAMRAS